MLVVSIALGGGFIGSWLQKQLVTNSNPIFIESNTPIQRVNLPNPESFTDFVVASEISTPTVVFIKTKSNAGNNAENFWFFGDFFGNRGPAYNTGSGVIISADGFIVTNYHVIDKADAIEVILNNKHSYEAKVIGQDPSTDLALLKIEAKNLKPIVVGNSDQVKIGEWVLAVGNPFNLTSTVTAGIVSAKGRNINIVNSQFPIESFIQTDAAINPGNSGGALVNLKGELIGINTAIASQTGSYNGYGFAIPVNIVKKIVKDFIDYGEVQRAFIGMEVADIDAKLAQKIGNEDYSGVYIESISSDGSAKQAGIKPGDVLLKVNGIQVNSKAEYLEQLSYYRPGEKIKLVVRSGNTYKEVVVTLTNREGTTDVLKKISVTSKTLGADFTPLSKVEKEKLRVKSGYKVSEIRGGLIRQMGLPEGFTILSVNQVVPESVEELISLLENTRGRITIDGIHPNGGRGMYSFFMY
ncbi:MAG: trypsin-like peptidase domain-containing protein [Bacteroidia bacterium]|nr:trypsin-like peptidase domain-containing protein [Bacteroidia bacterium]